MTRTEAARRRGYLMQAAYACERELVELRAERRNVLNLTGFERELADRLRNLYTDALICTRIVATP
jgi:hypothetical protein